MVSTIPSWSQRSGSNTFSTLFTGYPKDKLANIYTRADLPDSEVCDRYFRILESSVIKSCIKPIATGCEVKKAKSDSNNDEAISERKRYSFFTRHRWRIFLWLRELGWKLGNWKSAQLDEFLEDYSPDVFVFHIESYWYFNRLNKYIISKAQPSKVIGYLWDDNFTYKQQPYSLFAKIHRYFTRRQVKELVGLCDTVFTISPKMQQECDQEFGINSILLTKPLLVSNKTEYTYNKNKPIRIVYSGSLVIGRDKAIEMLVECLKEINRNGIRIYLDIYSGTALSEKKRKLLDVPGISNFKGHLPQKQVFKEQETCDILLFVENPNNKYHNEARLSFSTKITDYLSRNRAILAIGPSDIAPMEYLKNENAAMTCSSKQDILAALSMIVENPKILSDLAYNAYSCGERNHSQEYIINKFRKEILSTYE